MHCCNSIIAVGNFVRLDYALFFHWLGLKILYRLVFLRKLFRFIIYGSQYFSLIVDQAIKFNDERSDFRLQLGLVR